MSVTDNILDNISNNKNKTDFNVMLLIDDNFVYYSTTFIYSLIVNNNSWANIKIYIVTDKLSLYSRNYLTDFIRLYGAEVNFIDVDTSIFAGLKANNRYPALLYCKLIPHLILPDNIDKAIFFDVDMVCDGSLEELYNTDMGDKYFAACYGYFAFMYRFQQNDLKRTEVERSFVNSGVMLCNLGLMRNDCIELSSYTEWLKYNRQTLFEEQLLINVFLKKIYYLMPYDYNYNPGGREIYTEYCNKNHIEPKRLIIHYLLVRNDSPITKPWDAYEYFYEGKKNDKFPEDIYELYGIWWKYALQLKDEFLINILNLAKRAKLEKDLNSIKAERNMWHTYSDTFKQLINSNQLEYGEDTIKNIERAFLSKGHRRVAIYGDTEISKVLCNVLGGGTNISIKYIVEDSKKPVKGFKTIDRNPANYPDCDVMLIADIFRYNEIEAKLKKLQLSFPFYNAAEYIKSLPAGSGDGMQKIKDKIEMLNGKVKALSKEKAEYTAKYERTYGELQAIKNSLSFKVGRMITFIPRKLRNAFKRKK